MTSLSAVPTPLPDRRRSARLIAATGIAIVALAVTADGGPLTPIKAIVLGAVEGITEYLPISSTGHLLVTQRLLGLGTGPGKVAADTYAIAIQLGAILAVVALYRHRISHLAKGVIGRDDAGRQLLTRLIVAFVPAAALPCDSSQLVRELPEFEGPLGTMHLVYPSSRLLPQRVTLLRDFLIEHLKFAEPQPDERGLDSSRRPTKKKAVAG